MSGRKKILEPDFTLLKINWWDHSGFLFDKWRGYSEIVNEISAIMMTSVGYLIEENKKHYILSGSVDPANEVATGTILILKSCVVRKKVIKL